MLEIENALNPLTLVVNKAPSDCRIPVARCLADAALLEIDGTLVDFSRI